VRKSFALGFLVTSILLGSAAQLLFRIAMLSYDVAVIELIAAISIRDMILLAVGIALYGISMVTWILTLVRFNVSHAYPAMSMSYVIVYVVAVYSPWLGETASTSGLIGIGCIILGVVFLSLGETPSSTNSTNN